MIKCHVFLDFTEKCEQEGVSREVDLPVVPHIGWHLNYMLQDENFSFWAFKVCKVELSPASVGDPTVYAVLDEKESSGPGNMCSLNEIGSRELLDRVDSFVEAAHSEGWKT